MWYFLGFNMLFWDWVVIGCCLGGTWGDEMGAGEHNMGWGSWEREMELKGGEVSCSKKGVGLRCGWLIMGKEIVPGELHSKVGCYDVPCKSCNVVVSPRTWGIVRYIRIWQNKWIFMSKSGS